MNEHTLTRDGDLLVCGACDWRGVLTTAGLVTTQQGDRTATHTWVDHRRDWAEAAMTRLRTHYATQQPLPEKDDNRDDLVEAGVTDPRILTLAQLKRLYRCVASEHAL